MKLNIKKNISYSIAAFVINGSLIYITYRTLIYMGGVDVLGIWSVLAAWAALIKLGDTGMSAAITQTFAKAIFTDEDKRSAIDRNKEILEAVLPINLLFFGVINMVGTFLLYANASEIVPMNYEEDAQIAILINGCTMLISNISSLFVAALAGLHLNHVNSKITIVSAVGVLIMSLPLVMYFGLVGVAVMYLLQQLIIVFLQLYFLKLNKINPQRLVVKIQIIKSLLKVSMQNQLTGVLNSGFEPVSKILVGYIGGTQAQGYFELAYKTISVPRNAAASGSSAAIPTLTSLAEAGGDEGLKLFNKINLANKLSSAAILFFGVMLSPIFSIMWLGYYDYALIAACAGLALGFSINLLGAPYYNLGLSFGDMRGNVVSSFLALASMVVAYLLCKFFSLTDVSFVPAVVGLSVGGLVIYIINSKIKGSLVKVRSK
jgi:O-antigen/teichoic acid export membrane protein